VETKEKVEVKKLKNKAKDDQSFAPRLLDLKAASAYSGLTYWCLRDLLNSGVIPKVTVPCPYARVKVGGKLVRVPVDDGTTMRRILVDRKDLDEFIERYKEFNA
jgi:hypothetical protein